MKKFVRLAAAALCAVLVLGVTAFAACKTDGGAAPRKSCLVRVEGGSGGGYYYVDTNCTVTAEVPQGKQFIKWVSGETDLSPNAEYTFTVTKNVSLKAVFAEDIPDIEVYSVNVRYGYGGGNYLKGTTVHLTAGEYYGATFIDWAATYTGADGVEVTETVSTEPEFDLTVDKNVSIQARYDGAKLETPNNANGEMFKIAANGAYELDRNKDGSGNRKTAFVPGCAMLLYNVYELKEGTESEFELVSQVKVIPIGHQVGEYHHYMYDMEETMQIGLKGGSGDIYQDVAAQKDEMRKAMKVQAGKKYYISVRAMGGDDTPIDSEESVKFAVQF